MDLPGVQLLRCLLSRALPDVADMQQQLADVLKSELICLPQIETKEITESILGQSQPILHFGAESSSFRFLCKFVIHLFDSQLEVIFGRSRVTRFAQFADISEDLEGQHLSCIVHCCESYCQSGSVGSEFPAVLLERKADGDDL